MLLRSFVVTAVLSLTIALLAPARAAVHMQLATDVEALPACAELDALGIPKQLNLRAARAMVNCGREQPGQPESAPGHDGIRYISTQGDFTMFVGQSPHVTQTEHQIWAEGSTVVVSYNDSSAAPNNYSGLAVARYYGWGDGAFIPLLPSPFTTGHGTNYGGPMVVYNRKLGTWYAGDIVTGCGGQGIGLWTSTAPWATWTVGACVHNGTNDDRGAMTVDNNPASPYFGRMYVSWNDFAVGGGALYVARSDDGVAWTPAVVFGTFRRNVQVQVAENGAILLAAMDEGGGGSSPRANYLFRSSDGGATFSTPISMGQPFAAPCDFNDGYFRICNPIWRYMGWGDLATGSNNVAIYAYAVHGAGGDGGDIYIVRSTDNGATWGVPTRIDGDPGSGEAWMPSMVGSGPNFLVSWYDRRNTTDGANYQRLGMMSRDGGQSWSMQLIYPWEWTALIRQANQPDPNLPALYAGHYMHNYFDGVRFYDGWTGSVFAEFGLDVSAQVLALVAPFDVDGDGKTDRTVFRPSNQMWYSALSGGGARVTNFGLPGDIDVAADYDGDGKTDLAVWRPSTGVWHIADSSGGVRDVYFGQNGDIPMPAEVRWPIVVPIHFVVFRPSTGTWWIKNCCSPVYSIAWGVSGDTPLLGDYDGDAIYDLTIYRPSNGVWYILKSAGGSIVVGWGIPGDIPVVGDWDGDGKSDVAVFRPGTGEWFVNESTEGPIVVTWGTAGDIPVTDDFDGDGKSDFTIFRPDTGVWFTQFASGGVAAVGWGTIGDKPLGRVPGS